MNTETAQSLLSSAAAMRGLAASKKFKKYATTYLAAADAYEDQAMTIVGSDQGGQISAHFAT